MAIVEGNFGSMIPGSAWGIHDSPTLYLPSDQSQLLNLPSEIFEPGTLVSGYGKCVSSYQIDSDPFTGTLKVIEIMNIGLEQAFVYSPIIDVLSNTLNIPTINDDGSGNISSLINAVIGGAEKTIGKFSGAPPVDLKWCENGTYYHIRKKYICRSST